MNAVLTIINVQIYFHLVGGIQSSFIAWSFLPQPDDFAAAKSQYKVKSGISKLMVLEKPLKVN